MNAQMDKKPTASNRPRVRRESVSSETPPPPISQATAQIDESHAIEAAARVNGWVLIRTTDTADGGHRYVYANDLSSNIAARPALAVLTTDASGRVIHARRDIARRTFTDEQQRETDDIHVFDFADSVFRVK